MHQDGPSNGTTTAVLVIADAALCGGTELQREVRILAQDNRVLWDPPAVDVPEDVQRMQLDGVVVPGLVDHHVHTEHVDMSVLLAGGLSGVRDLGANPELVFALARRSRSSADLPLVAAVGPILTAPGGYPSDRDWARGGTYRTIADPDEARAAIGELSRQGAAGITIALHTGSPATFADESLDAVVQAAHAVALPVIAHLEGAGEPERAQRAGVDELAHTPWTERLTDAAIQACAATMS
jgi:imidazolonepropionase-like amidohydrolase